MYKRLCHNCIIALCEEENRNSDSGPKERILSTMHVFHQEIVSFLKWYYFSFLHVRDEAYSQYFPQILF